MKISSLEDVLDPDGLETVVVLKHGRARRTRLDRMVQPLFEAAWALFPKYFKGDKGNPGANVMAVGLFTDIPALNVPNGADMIQTAGHGRVGFGSARYVADASVTAAYAAAHPLWTVRTANGRGFRLAEEWATPDHCGAIGHTALQEVSGVNTAAVDHPAFRAISDYFNQGYGTVLTFREGASYYIGKQVPHPAGPQYAYRVPENPIHIERERLTVVFAGRFIWNPDMKFGSFDPATGQKLETTLPFFDYSKRADIGTMFNFIVDHYEDYGQATINGNSLNMDVGGGWGDVGFQLDHTGIRVVHKPKATYLQAIDGNNPSPTATGKRSAHSIAKLYIHDFLLDGMIVQWDYRSSFPGGDVNNGADYRFYGLKVSDGPMPSTILNKTVNRVGRNCMSIVGGYGLFVDHCLLMNPGMGYHKTGRIGSPPCACLDWEAEAAVLRDCGTGPNTYLVGGPFHHTTWVGDSGDSLDLYARGTTWYGCPWTSIPGTVWDGVKSYGRVGQLCGVGGGLRKREGVATAASADESTIIRNSLLSDQARFGAPSEAPNMLIVDMIGAGPGIRFQADNTIKFASIRPRLEGMINSGVLTLDVGISRETIGDNDYFGTMGGGSFGKVRIVDSVPRAPNLVPTNFYQLVINGALSGEIEFVPHPDGQFKVRLGSGDGALPTPQNKQLKFDFTSARNTVLFGFKPMIQDSAASGYINVDIAIPEADFDKVHLSFSARTKGTPMPAHGISWWMVDGIQARVYVVATANFTAPDVSLHWRYEKKAA